MTASKRSRRDRLKILLPLALLLVGVGFVFQLFITRPEPEKEPPESASAPVTVVAIEPRSVRARVHARGRVQAAQRVELVPHVTGPVSWVSDRLIPGGRFERGEAILRVDRTDYRLAVDVQKAEVGRAAVELRREQNRKQASEQAWQLYQSARERDISGVDRPFVLNEPQLAAAQQAVQSAKSRLRQAQVELRRAVLRAPLQRGGGRQAGSHLALVTVDLVAAGERDVLSSQFAEAWRKELGGLPEADSLVFSYSTGATAGAPINIELSHERVETLEAAASELAEALSGYAGVRDVDNGFSRGKERLDFVLTDVGRAHGLTDVAFANQLRAANFGAEVQRIQQGRNEVRTYVRLAESERESLEDLHQLILRTPRGGDAGKCAAAPRAQV